MPRNQKLGERHIAAAHVQAGPFGEFGPFGLGRLFGAARMGSLVGAFDWGCFDYSGDMGWGPQKPSRSAVVDGPCGTAHVIARAGLEAN